MRIFNSPLTNNPVFFGTISGIKCGTRAGRAQMKKERSAQLKVGIFVLVSIAIFVYGVFTISGQDELFEKEYTVKTYFDNTAGLLEGAYVRLSGVGVGSVSSIRFSDDPSLGKVQVVMEVNKRALVRVTKDLFSHDQDRGASGGRNSSRLFPATERA